MKYAVLAFAAAMLLMSFNCATRVTDIETASAVHPTSRDILEQYDIVWNTAIDTLSEYRIVTASRQDGQIVTDWRHYSIDRKIAVDTGVVARKRHEEIMPVEVMERLTVTITPLMNDATDVTIFRDVKIRPYHRDTLTGSWVRDTSGDFTENISNTQTEHNLLDIIERNTRKKQ